jgi:hypothetical protein
VPKEPKRARSLSFDEQVLSDSEMPTAEDLTLEGTEGIDDAEPSIAFDEMADFFCQQDGR